MVFISLVESYELTYLSRFLRLFKICVIVLVRKQNELKKSRYAFRLLEKLGTNPKVYYVSTRDWVRKAGEAYAGEEAKGVTHVTHA